jgi:hypothetical protein
MAAGSVMKFIAPLFGFFVFGASAFVGAADYTPTVDLSPATLTDTTPAGVWAFLETTPIDNSAAVDNTALISQDGTVHPNSAYIDQSGVGNVSILLQDGTYGMHSDAIYQIGNYNISVIYQH